ncbi:type VI secretion system protein TssA [Paraburkholderia sp. NMBU_R16]|uniref:type VI secretion system protein TssA n=1 Tax=Paraburkholderia sp. NMBU_R16 TaxID=2698676 RepID=UPI00156565E9|nr:type VI secretion system protein TssA [Paraburkholderia sp. NMBU_R16]NRO97440.1 type VI secretion system protein TssA [Paraburkholderia sp. NMBU_R16]
MDRAQRVEALLAEIEHDAPCGPNLEYEPEYLALEQSAVGKPEQQYGDTVIPAEAPDWVAVERLALALFSRTKDLRIASHLTRSWIELRGLVGYADGLHVAAALVERWWEDVHPRLDSDGEADPTPRMNALAEMVGAHGCAQAARAQSLIDTLSVRDAGRVIDGLGAELERYPGGCDRLQADLLRSHEAGQPALRAGLDALDAIDAIRACVAARLGQEWSFDASECEKTLRRIRHDLLAAAGTQHLDVASTTGDPTAAEGGQGQADPTGSARHARLWQAAELSSRDDVRIGLEKMCRYFEVHEPSHPAPILLRRAQRLLTLDFYEIIRDLVPESLPRLDELSGQRGE